MHDEVAIGYRPHLNKVLRMVHRVSWLGATRRAVRRPKGRLNDGRGGTGLLDAFELMIDVGAGSVSVATTWQAWLIHVDLFGRRLRRLG